jgi:RNA polymerase sigma-70 factor (ECF subfamily)
VEHGEVRRLYDEHGAALLAYASSLLRDPSAAEDVLHQVFLKLLAGRFAINGQAVAYLFRAVRNTALNHIRGQSREVDLEHAPVWLEGAHASRETSLALQSALATLPQEQREVVVLHVWGQLTFEEAAGVIGISPNTAASRYRYGVAKLREIWHG